MSIKSAWVQQENRRCRLTSGPEINWCIVSISHFICVCDLISVQLERSAQNMTLISYTDVFVIQLPCSEPECHFYVQAARFLKWLPSNAEVLHFPIWRKRTEKLFLTVHSVFYNTQSKHAPRIFIEKLSFLSHRLTTTTTTSSFLVV